MKTISIIILLILWVCNIYGQEIHENILENQTYKERISYFKVNPLHEGQIVFLGNSLTQHGDWEKYFPEQHPANRGIAGDNTLGMLGRLHEIIAARPSKLFIMAGINDISLGRSNEMIMTGIKSMIYQIKEGSPDTKIYVQSLLPINSDKSEYRRLIDKEKEIEKLNKELKKLCEKESVIFIDIYSSFLSDKRTLDPIYTEDGLHLNENGYAVWASLIRGYIEHHPLMESLEGRIAF